MAPDQNSKDEHPMDVQYELQELDRRLKHVEAVVAAYRDAARAEIREAQWTFNSSKSSG